MADSKFAWVRSIYGDAQNGKKWYNHISNGVINDYLKEWNDKQPERDMSVCSPSGLTTCPRAIWYSVNGYERTDRKTWAVKQRLLLGRVIENLIAKQLDDLKALHHHWKDDIAGESDKFYTEDPKLEGTPDLLIDVNGVPSISDSKSGRSDGFGYKPVEFDEFFSDYLNYKYKVQLDAYYYLSWINRQWFEDNLLPLPEQCHLFIFSLDDGLVRREFTWKPTQEDMLKVERLARRYNDALTSTTMPECVCEREGQAKFCPYGQYDGKRVAESCCDITKLERK